MRARVVVVVVVVVGGGGGGGGSGGVGGFLVIECSVIVWWFQGRFSQCGPVFRKDGMWLPVFHDGLEKCLDCLWTLQMTG